MNELFNGLDYVRMYIDNLLIISNKSSEDHIKKIDRVWNKLKSAGLKGMQKKSFFARNELEYLGFKINREGAMPLSHIVEAIKNIPVPTTKKQLQTFIELINY